MYNFFSSSFETIYNLFSGECISPNLCFIYFSHSKDTEEAERKTHLFHILLLLFFECELNEYLLQFLITVVDDKLLKAVCLHTTSRQS